MPEVTVFGSYIMDLTCKSPHIPVVGETVFSGPFVMGPGGKGFNQAVAAKMAGLDVAFVTQIGKDLFNSFVKDAYDRFGLSREYLFESDEEATGVALITVEQDTGRNAIAVAVGACEAITREDVRGAAAAFEGCKVFLTQFESNLEATHEAMQCAHGNGAKILLNPAPYREFDREILKLVDVIMPNEIECGHMTGLDCSNDDGVRRAGRQLAEDIETVIVTLGDRGVFCPQLSDDIIPAYEVDTIDTTGAGDAFAGILAAYLARGYDLAEAIALAQVGAALSTCKFGTSPSMPTQAEIEKAAASGLKRRA